MPAGGHEPDQRHQDRQHLHTAGVALELAAVAATGDDNVLLQPAARGDSVAASGADADGQGELHQWLVDGQHVAVDGARPAEAGVVRQCGGVRQGEQHPVGSGAHAGAGQRVVAADAVVRGAERAGAGVSGDGECEVPDGDGVDAAGVSAGELLGLVGGRTDSGEQ